VFLQFLQKLSPEKKLKGRHWKDEISALTSVSLGSSGDLLLGLQKSAVVATFLKSAPSISLYGFQSISMTDDLRSKFDRKFDPPGLGVVVQLYNYNKF
jgi:hypothetical protein